MQAFNDGAGPADPAIIPLQRLQEAYPDLKSNQNFLALQDQLEGTENRIDASRRDYNEAVQAYNTPHPHLPRRDRREGVLRRQAQGAVRGRRRGAAGADGQFRQRS